MCVFEVCIINQTKGVSEPDRVFELAVEMGRNRSAFKKSSFVKKGAVKDVDGIINGGSNKPTELGCVQGGFISPSSEVKV
jgi:hypothetical protein